ncbi:MAG TPA: PH domain-containing protein [Candidatus Eisenbacteria bacterium]|nr:PH domain-containing protein [Candidatus Eisenbacteria bacterium]
MDIVNSPEVSRPLAWFYIGTATLVAALALFIVYMYSQKPILVGLLGLVVIIVVEIIIVSITVSIYTTRYTLTQNNLILRASIFIGGTKKIPLNTIEATEKSLIPFGIRLFGASGYGGYCYFPTIGKAFVVITNFKDGVLIRAKQGIYLITPKNPDEFIESIKRTGKPDKA